MAASANLGPAVQAGGRPASPPRVVAPGTRLPADAPCPRLTLKNAIARALANQALVLQAQHQMAAQAALRKAAQADVLPSLSLAAGGIWTQTRDSQPVFVSANGAREVVGQLRLHVPVYAPSTYALEALARAGVVTARYQEQQARLAVAAQVSAAYYRLALLDNEEQVWRKALDAARDLFTATRQGYRNGTRSRLDLTQAKLTVADAQAGLDRTVPQAQAASRVLALELGYGPGALPCLSQIGPPVSALSPPAAFDAKADRMQPLLRVADGQIQAQKAAVRLRQAARLPQVAVDGGYGLDTTATPQAGNLGWQAAVTVQMPLFGFGRDRDRVDAAREQLEALQAGKNALALTVHTRIAADYGSAQAADKSVRNERLIAREAQAISTMTRKGYLLGTLSALALSQAENHWVQARLAYAGAAIRARLARTQLALDAGILPDSEELP
ncbi:MAG: TolC family protein [Betaproteobacteria bacterium]|nr:TolC family protein [Betaproteobacteria bacterium]